MASLFKRISKKPPRVQELHQIGLKERFIGWKQDYSAANRGTRIHTGTDYVLTGGPLELLPERVTGTKYSELGEQMEPNEYASVAMAVKKLDSLGFHPEYVEAPVYGHDPMYAGTVDYIGTIRKTMRGKKRKIRALIDLKTGARVSRAYISQLAAYARATEILVDGEIRPMPRIDIALILDVRPDSAKLYQVDIEYGYRLFVACHLIRQAVASKTGMTAYE